MSMGLPAEGSLRDFTTKLVRGFMSGDRPHAFAAGILHLGKAVSWKFSRTMLDCGVGSCTESFVDAVERADPTGVDDHAPVADYAPFSVVWRNWSG